MPVPSAISDLSQTEGSNSPAGGEFPSTTDNYLRQYAAFIASLRDGKGFANPVQLASAATTDIGGQNSLFVEVTGTTTITSFGTNYNGPRLLRFASALTLTHNASTLSLPGGANITTEAGDSCTAVPTTALGGWNVTSYQRSSTAPGVPPGTVIHVAMNSAPGGYLKCNGAAVSRTTYAALFAAIGTTFGVGDGSTTFNLPELRGEFIRGWDDSRGVDTGRVFGSSQTSENKAHTHTGTTDSGGSHSHTIRIPPNIGDTDRGTNPSLWNIDGEQDVATSTDGAHTHTFTTASSGGASETRPRSIALLACIKF